MYPFAANCQRLKDKKDKIDSLINEDIIKKLKEEY
jgi:hypothetical protein